MVKKCFAVLVGVLFFSGIIVGQSFADGVSRDEEISGLKGQVQDLLKRIERLEAEQLSSKEESSKVTEELKKVKEGQAGGAASKVDLANSLAKIGRASCRERV